MTAGDVITFARRVLKDQDQGGSRWRDVDLLNYLSDAQRRLFNQSPSLFLTSGDTINTPVELTALTDEMKVDETGRWILVNWTVASALMEDSDDARNFERALQVEQLGESEQVART